MYKYILQYIENILKFPTTYFKFKLETKKGLQYHVKIHMYVQIHVTCFLKTRKINTSVVKRLLISVLLIKFFFKLVFTNLIV